MLVPAILYKDQIISEMQKYYYTDDMLYETGCILDAAKKASGAK